MEIHSNDNFLCIFFCLCIFFRVHILHHGRMPLWAKWTGSAEKAVAWISGCRSSTCLNDENVNTKNLQEDLIICTRVVWTLMDTLPSRDQIPKCSKMLMRQENFGRKEKNTTAVYQGMYLNEGKKKKFLQGMDFHFGQKRVGVASNSGEKTRSHGSRIKPKACVCFLMWRRTLCRRTVSCMRG